jgi:hypothetical protein
LPSIFVLQMASHQLGGVDSGDPADDTGNGLEIVGDSNLIVDSKITSIIAFVVFVLSCLIS